MEPHGHSPWSSAKADKITLFYIRNYLGMGMVYALNKDYQMSIAMFEKAVNYSTYFQDSSLLHIKQQKMKHYRLLQKVNNE